MNARISFVVGLTAVVCALSACATQYRSDVHADAAYDFATIERVAIRMNDAQLPEPMAHNHTIVVREVREQLAAKGFEVVDGEDADILMYVSAGRFARIRLSGGNNLSAEEGRIILNVVVSETGHTVWYGSIATTLNDRTQADVVIPPAVAELMAQFPKRGQDIGPASDTM